MLIRTVDFPRALLTAQREGKLAVFAGAGVSMPAPSNYPNFKNLAKQVAGGKLELGESEPIDVFLGRLVDLKVPVHQEVARLLDLPESRPNSLHLDLLRLFRDPESVRLVTTNFDLHFNKASQTVFGDVASSEVHAAPALPLGHSFSGIVALHGSVDRPHDRLVLTDSDFGRAYLTEGWARVFLQRLFETYTVLFVGYSHDDPVMNYIARGFTPEMGKSRRFALTQTDQEARWTYRGVAPISYELTNDENRHSAVALSLTSWAEMSRLGMVEREEKIKTIVEQQPSPIDSEETDYILDALTEPPTARFYARHAVLPSWLKWVEEKKLLKSLFDPHAKLSEVEIILGNWIADNFQCQHSGKTLSLLTRQGQFFNPFFWYILVHKLAREWKAYPHQAVLRRWLAVLLSRYPQEVTSERVSHLSAVFLFPDDTDVALLTFEFLGQPVPTVERDLWAAMSEEEGKEKEENVTLELSTQGNGYWLNHFWTRFFEPNIDALATVVEPIIRAHLVSASVFYRLDKGLDGPLDAFSISRNAIEQRDYGRQRGGLGVLIDAALVIGRWFVANRPIEANTLIEQWFRTQSFVLKRLAVLMVAESRSWSPDDMLSWLLAKDLLYTFGFKHEVFAVLRDAYPSATVTSQERLVKAIKEGRPNVPAGRPDLLDYERYNLLVWLCEHAPEDRIAIQARQELVNIHPEYAPRESPDRDIVFRGGFVGDVSPKTTEELLEQKPDELINYLITYKSDAIFGPTRAGLIQRVTSAAKKYEWGWKLTKLLRERDDAPADLWSALVRAWSESELQDPEWEDILQLLDSSKRIRESIPGEIATLLESGIKKPTNAIPISCYEPLDHISSALWSTVKSTSQRPKIEGKEGTDWVFRAINHPAGTLTLFLLGWLVRRRKEAGANWKKLPEDLERGLSQIVTDDTYAGTLGRVVLSSQLNLLFASDEVWTKEKIVPLFDWDRSKEQAIQSFSGFFTWGQQSEKLLLVLLPLYEKIFRHTTELGEVRERFTEYLAGLAMWGDIDPLKQGWLTRFVSSAQDVDRQRWAAQIQRILRGASDAVRDGNWYRWMKDYWTARNQSKPLALAPLELGEMVEWTIFLHNGFPEATTIIGNGPAYELRNSFLFRELAESSMPADFPSASGELLLSVLKNTREAQFDLDKVEDVVRKVAPQGVSREVLERICDELGRLGYPEAAPLKRWARENTPR